MHKHKFSTVIRVQYNIQFEAVILLNSSIEKILTIITVYSKTVQAYCMRDSGLDHILNVIFKYRNDDHNAPS